MITGQHLISYSLILFGCAFVCLLGRLRKLSTFCVTAGLFACLYGFILRYFHAFPMIPMYVGLHGTTCTLTIIWLLFLPTLSSGSQEKRILLTIIILFSAVLLFFPKDFYLPLLRSASTWAHLFLLTGIMAKGFLLIAAVLGINILRGYPQGGIGPAMSWGIWGFALLSISMFSGECWSYLGWGTPVVWYDPAITTTMALWFYWVAVLHLRHSRRWRRRNRAIFVVTGGILVLLSCWPDMGPFRSLFRGLL